MEKDLSKSLDLHPPLNSDTPAYNHEQLTKQIIGCAIEVHRRLGPGFLESIYEEAFSLELNKQGVVYDRQRLIRILYEDTVIGMQFAYPILKQPIFMLG